MIHRCPWGSFPAVWIHAEELAVKRHPDYASAKAGDSDSAFRLVAALATDDVCQQLRLRFPDRPILVSAHAVERDGLRLWRNAWRSASIGPLIPGLSKPILSGIPERTASHGWPGRPSSTVLWCVVAATSWWTIL